MSIDATTLATPIGDLALLAQDEVIVAAGFAPVEAMAARLPDVAQVVPRRNLGALSAAVDAYFAGDVGALDDVPVEQPGGTFQQAAWLAMRTVPPGEVITYAELADRAGNPRAIRAAGSACARNRVAPIVPCHRVVRAGGPLGGYYYGLTAKQWLLDHERRATADLRAHAG